MKFKISVVLFFITFLFAQFPGEHKSIHQIEWEMHLNDPEQSVFYKEIAVTIQPLQKRTEAGSGLTHAVFGYLPDWKRSSAPPYFDYSVLSHIALFDFTVDTQGNIIGYPAGWPSDWTSTMNAAHANGVKLIMCVVEFNDDDIHALINSSTASQNFYEEVATVIENYNLDGVIIDFEGPQVADRGTPMNNFMQGLNNYIKTNVGPEQEISFAGPAVNWSGWDLPGLVDACDYVFIMGYAYWWNGASTTGPCAPITGSSYNLEQTIVNSSNGYGSCDRSKLILGLPYYGNKWKVSYSQRATENATTLANGSSVFYATAKDYYASHGRQWSTRYEDPWTYYESGGDWYQAWCNDAEALDAKEKLVFTYNLMGTGMWALGYDEEHTELWDILRENFLEADSSMMLDNFEDGPGHFFRQPTYSGSTQGVSLFSSSDTCTEAAYVDEHSLKITLVDDGSSSDDWKVRLLSGSGDPSYNIQFSKSRDIQYSLKTAHEGFETAVLIDDGSELESSLRMVVPADDQWHTYSVRLDSAELWTSYSNGDGVIDADYVTLDAIMFYSPEQVQDKTVYLDAVQVVTPGKPLDTSVVIVPEFYDLYPNYPNPFNAQTTIKYKISNAANIRINIYDIREKLVKTLVSDDREKGEYTVVWQTHNTPSGMYIAVMQANGVFIGSQKLLLVK